MIVQTPVLRDGAWWASRLDVARGNVPTDFHAGCPSCLSRNNLHVTDVPGRDALLKCFSGGCEYEEIVNAVDAPEPAKAAVPAPGRTGRQAFLYPGGIAKTRIDHADGSKEFRWPKGTKPNDLLYGADNVPSFDPDKPVVLVEGERKRDHLAAVGQQALSLSGGAASRPTAEALSVLAGRDVILWPDNDEPGRKVMDSVAKDLADVARSVRLVRWTDAPPKGDATDFLQAHDKQALQKLLDGAQPWLPGGSAALEVVGMADLLAKELPPLKYAVAGLLPEGLALLVAAPKIGKSWLASQACVAVAVGGELLGRAARRGPALYLALEDGERRAQSRARLALDRMGVERWPEGAVLDIAFNAERGDEMVAQVESWLAAHPNAVLVVIDVLQKVRPVGSGRRNQYELDSEDVGRVLEIAKRHPGLTVLVVHHDRKQQATDFLDAVSGTHGISGSVDTVLVIRRDRQSDQARIDVTGRDVDETTLHARFDEGYWVVDPLGGLTEPQIAMWELVRDNGPIGPTDAAALADKTKGDAHRLLKFLHERGMVAKDALGRYSAPGMQLRTGQER